MTEMPYVMLAKSESMVELIAVAVFIAISVIGAIVQKAAKERESKQEREKRAGRSEGSAPAPRPRYKPLTEQPARKGKAEGADGSRRQEAARQLRNARQRSALQNPKAPEPAPRQQPATVEDEVLQQRRRLAKVQAERKRRLAARKPPEADTAAIESRLVHVAPGVAAAAETLPTGTGMRETLASADRARTAMIFHEIFSSPKALRRGPEMWEL